MLAMEERTECEYCIGLVFEGEISNSRDYHSALDRPLNACMGVDGSIFHLR